MRILHITQFLGVGGLEKLLLSLMLEQQKLGHTPVLLVYGDDQSWVDYFRSQGITILNDYRKKAGYDFGVIQQIKKHYSNFDIIHTHDINPAMYVAPLLRLTRLPFSKRPRWIHTAHGMDHIKQVPRTRFYERWFTTQADVIVGVASHVCQTYRKELGASEQQVALVENGIAIPNLSNTHKTHSHLAQILTHKPQGKIWTCVSRVVPLKDQALILQAARSFPQDTFILVGPSGDDAYWKQLLEDCPKNAFMIGPNNNISQLLLESDYFISASRHEGIPLAVLEAGAHQLPCVLSAIPGHITLKKDEGEIAEFFPTGELNGLIESMKRIVGNTAHSQKLALTFHSTVVRHFSAEQMTKSYLQLYGGSRA